MAAPANRGWLAKFEREVDPENQLPEPERQARAIALRKVYMQRMAIEREKRRKNRLMAIALVEQGLNAQEPT